MQRFWNAFTRPLLDLLEPRCIVEVGAAGGGHTARLLAWCRDHGARLHVVDPEPIGNLKDIGELMTACGTHHRGLSLEVLPKLPAELYLLDGDHNGYTVRRELEALRSANAGAAFPAVLFHDVDWPYGRRDMYHDPSNIPAEHRRPTARSGMAPGRSELCGPKAFNSQVENALVEGGPGNGVLGGLEDFRAGAGFETRYLQVPGFHGLGLLYDPKAHAEPTCRGIEALFALPANALAHIRTMEDYRLELETRYVNLMRELRAIKRAQV